MHKDLCRGRAGICKKMNPIKGKELLDYLRKVEFLGEVNNTKKKSIMKEQLLRNYYLIAQNAVIF